MAKSAVYLMTVLTVVAVAHACAASTAFTYQGKLTDSVGAPMTGPYDLTFKLFDAETGGSQVGSNVVLPGVNVSNGLFTAQLDFGASAFSGADRWLETVVGAEVLSPRTKIAAAPYAITAQGLILPFWGSSNNLNPAIDIVSTGLGDAIKGTVSGSGRAGYFQILNPASTSPAIYAKTTGIGPAGQFQGNVNVTGTATLGAIAFDPVPPAGTVLGSDGVQVSWQAANAWSLTGNAGTTPGTHFIGTTDNQAVEVKVDGARALRIEPASDLDYGSSPNIIGGYGGNAITPGVVGAFIGAGGSDVYESALICRVTDSFGVVAGGLCNRAGDDDSDPSSAVCATVGGGNGNSAAGFSSTVSGGYHNCAVGAGSFVGGGQDNGAWDNYATVVGGSGNGAGDGDIDSQKGRCSTVGGGTNNYAGGEYATVPGGACNAARGDFSFAAGFYARTRDEDAGTFVWADAHDDIFESTGPNQFLIRAAGGVGINTNAPAAGTALDVNGPVRVQSLQFAGGGAAQTTPGWSMTGNAGTTPGTSFLGTTDNQPLELRVNNEGALTIEPAYDDYGLCPNIIGGRVNEVSSGVVGAFIGGGGGGWIPGQPGGPCLNRVTDRFGVVVGGLFNRAGGNDADTQNSASAFVGGGAYNTASGPCSIVGGGVGNTAEGNCATVPGGYSNCAGGDYSFAAGHYARARDEDAGTFVWSDGQEGAFESTNTNQFLVRASGGVGVNTSSPQKALHVASGDAIITGTNNFAADGDEAVLSLGNTSNYIKALRGGGLRLGTYYNVDGITLAYYGNVGIGTTTPTYKLHVNGSVAGIGAYQNLSDARFKTNIRAISGALGKVESLRGVSFDWKKDQHPELDLPDGRQIGLIAQEVEKVVPEVVSADDQGTRSVAYGSLVPVLIEAIKEQNKRIDELEKRVAQLENER